jgi:transcriptional regulator with XRE-family HTH domain
MQSARQGDRVDSSRPRTPVVLTDAEVGAELGRLAGELKAARQASSSGRDAAAAAGTNQSTVWRIENARTRPTFRIFVRLALVAGALLDLDDGRTPPRRPPRPEVLARHGYAPPPLIAYADWSPEQYAVEDALHRTRVRLGAELWWARRTELDPPLDAAGTCRLLGISHHTLTAVERGPGDLPDLASVVLVAGMTGRKVVVRIGRGGALGLV